MSLADALGFYVYFSPQESSFDWALIKIVFGVAVFSFITSRPLMNLHVFVIS